MTRLAGTPVEVTYGLKDNRPCASKVTGPNGQLLKGFASKLEAAQAASKDPSQLAPWVRDRGDRHGDGEQRWGGDQRDGAAQETSAMDERTCGDDQLRRDGIGLGKRDRVTQNKCVPGQGTPHKHAREAQFQAHVSGGLQNNAQARRQYQQFVLNMENGIEDGEWKEIMQRFHADNNNMSIQASLIIAADLQEIAQKHGLIPATNAHESYEHEGIIYLIYNKGTRGDTAERRNCEIFVVQTMQSIETHFAELWNEARETSQKHSGVDLDYTLSNFLMTASITKLCARPLEFVPRAAAVSTEEWEESLRAKEIWWKQHLPKTIPTLKRKRGKKHGKGSKSINPIVETRILSQL